MIRYNPNIKEGLNSNQVKQRINNNLTNVSSNIKTKSVYEIILYNTFTLFNVLNLGLGFLIFYVRSYKNLLFLGVVIINTLISIMQELRSKRIIDKLSIISSIKANVIRNGKMQTIKIDDVVLDDIISYERGNQVIADSVIKEGVVEVNESLISGEENLIVKRLGDRLYSGSFIVSGKCISQVEKVGKDNYASKITSEAKYIKKVKSEIMIAFKKIIKVLSIIIIPLGFLLFLKQYNLNHNLEDSIVSTVAAMIGMIPEGLILLTSTALAVSVIKLSKRRVLVQQLYCIEKLARVDILCLDKTGTLAEGIMEVEKVISLDKKFDYETVLSAIASELKNDNPTMEAIGKKFNKKTDLVCIDKEFFSSEKKYSSVTFTEGKYILGAPEVLDKSSSIKNILEENKDYRQLLLKKNNKNLAIILLKDKIKYKVLETLNFFKKQGVDIKIISGDSEKVIMQIAKRLNLENMKAIDMSSNKNINLNKISEDYNIFCRVTPNEKKEIIKSLKENGHVVAMVGDGVNDVLALKESDCSVAMANGSDAARNVSELVLLNSNFDSIPKIVGEGRKTINNIERSASLFLTKTIYSTILAFIFLFVPLTYPFQPIQLSLVSTITIGIPAFFLSLESNNDLIKENFMINILKKSLPGGITTVINVILVILFTNIFYIDENEISTMIVILVAITGFLQLYRICYKFTKLRLLLYLSLIFLFSFCVIGMSKIFELVFINPISIIYILLVFVLDIGIYNSIYNFLSNKL